MSTKDKGKFTPFGYVPDSGFGNCKFERTLKDRLALVNAGDTLTVVDTRGDTWTGKVRRSSATALRFGPEDGSLLRGALGPGNNVADIRDHVPAVIDTPEPIGSVALVQDAKGYIAGALNGGVWVLLVSGEQRAYADLTQPVTILYEGTDEGDDV